jgi:c(7)-type cytochrome triheme protein
VFGITAQCRKCHQDEPTTKYEVARPPTAFSHVLPQHEAAKLPCATCHPLAKTGEVLVAGHAVCAGCHADDFTKRAPTKCGACHNSTEPWRPLVADRLPAETTEFGAAIDHGKHALPCASCHSLATGRSELRTPRGHVACTTAGCHAITGGPAPQLAQCEACHVVGLVQQRERARLAATWSVRARFSHAPHRRENGKDVACTRCHVDLRSASVLSLASPPKQSCADCHDGSRAFDVTGTKCTRCHLGAKR